MPSLADVFRVLNDMKTAGVIEEYAIGGAMAALFYAEVTRTCQRLTAEAASLRKG